MPLTQHWAAEQRSSDAAAKRSERPERVWDGSKRRAMSLGVADI